MKFILSFLILFLITGQRGSVEGEYHNQFGSQLKINPDSTFTYNFDFFEISSWSEGKWKIKNDTIYFEVIPIFDTLRIENKKDTLVLSADKKPELITNTRLALLASISLGKQNRMRMSSKLYFDGEKLIEITKGGKLDKRKFKALGEKRKHHTWLVKSN